MKIIPGDRYSTFMASLEEGASLDKPRGCVPNPSHRLWERTRRRLAGRFPAGSVSEWPREVSGDAADDGIGSDPDFGLDS
jgi:hypothetical protein